MQADPHLSRSSDGASAFARTCLPAPRRKSFALKALPAAAALLFSPPGWPIDIAGGTGLPQNGTVFSGAASGSVAGNQLTINQSTTRAVVDWGSFNIDAGKAVQILQPSAAAAMLNRVTGDANPSQILGSLTANGTVMLMNPNGVMFGQNAVVNVGSLIATTGNIDVNNFINTGGAQITGAAGSITNEGSITAQGAGLVALVAPSVTNQGSIIATGGTIALAGGTAATVSLNGGLYEFAIAAGATGNSVSNTVGARLEGAILRLGVGDAANLLSGVINLEGVQQASNAIVVNGYAVVLKSALQAPSVSGNANRVDVYSGARIQDGVDTVVAGGTVNVAAGTYTGGISITKALTLDGAGMGQTIVKAPSAASGDAVTIKASGVTLSDLSINDSFYGVHLRNTANNVTLDRVAFNNNQYSVRSTGDTRADNFRMLNSTISGGLAGFQTYNNYGAGTGNASFKNALFENVTVDGTTFKGFYFETADNLTMRNVTITNAGNIGDPNSHLFGAAIDVNLKYGAYGSINFDNVVVKSAGSATSAAVVIKTRGIPGDGSDYTRSPASLQSVNITGGSIEDSAQAGIRFETLSNGSGGQPTVTISGSTQFKNNNDKDIVVDQTNVDARGAVFVGSADGFAIEDRVTHALDTAGRGLVTWKAGNVYVTQNSGSIQRGVDAAGIGDTVNVANASFAENVTVNARRDLTFNDTRLQSLTLGSGAAGTGIGGTVTADGARGFDFHKDASIRLLSDTTLATMGADISIKGDIQNAGNVARALKLIAGSGGTRGNVYMNTGGSEAKPLGHFDVSANNFTLESTLWVSGYKIDALGNVALSNSTLRAQDTGAASTLSAGGDVTGSTISLGSVEIASGGDIVANITATDIVAKAQGSMDLVLNASNSATLESGGPTKASGFAPVIVIDAPSGSLSGSFGQISNTGGGLINVNGKPQANQSLSANAENNRVVPSGNRLAEGFNADEPALQLAQAGMLAGEGDTALVRSSPSSAGEAIDNGQSVELDMSPGNEREKE